MEQYLKRNYHTHTFRCQHAYGTEREYVEKAIASGMTVLGFSDHIPCPFEDGYVSNIRMTMQQAEEYVDVIRALGKEYKDDITLYVGFEGEYIPAFFEKQMELFKELECDYLIMGQHFLKSENQGPYVGAETYDEKLLASYVDMVIEGMKTGMYRYLAHPDLANYLGSTEVYDKHMRRLCKSLKQMDIPLEINILGMKYNRWYPKESFWKIAAEENNKVILGIDAHEASQIGNIDAYKKCVQLAEKYALDVIDGLPGLM